MRTKSRNYFFYRGQTKSLLGAIGFYIQKFVTNKISIIETIFERIYILKMVIEKSMLPKVIKMCATTMQTDETEKFYPKIQLINLAQRNNLKILITFYQKRKNKWIKWIWSFLDGTTKNKIVLYLIKDLRIVPKNHNKRNIEKIVRNTFQ